MTLVTSRRLPAACLVGLLAVLSSAPLGAQDRSAGNSAVRPVPRKEGWWTQRHDRFLKRAQKGHVDVLFLGDSITQGWEGAGKAAWAESMEPLRAANFGIGGDQTQHVLWRITEGKELAGIHPKVAVLMIGTNNLHGNTDEQIEAGIRQIVKTLHRERPHMRILLLGIFPRGHEANDPNRKRIKDINHNISELDGKDNVHYLDIGKKFLEPDGTLTKEIMPDFLHLSPRGYAIETEAILPEIKKLLRE